MLSCQYFHVTVTVPEELRHVLRINQQDGHPLLLNAAAHAIIDIARDPRFVGGNAGVLRWLGAPSDVLRPAHRDTAAPLPPPRPLPIAAVASLASRTSLLPRSQDGHCQARARQTQGVAGAPHLIIPATALTTPWVVRITPWGEGDKAVLRYLARYVFRIAITNNRGRPACCGAP
jgi:hypothetical protein